MADTVTQTSKALASMNVDIGRLTKLLGDLNMRFLAGWEITGDDLVTIWEAQVCLSEAVEKLEAVLAK
jgi:hypothetical protein